MIKEKWILTLFGEGGDGGSAGEGAGEAGAQASGAQVAEDAELSRIPERAREAYKKARAKNQPQQAVDASTQASTGSNHVAYADLIKSDEYKEEHKAYMDRTIKDRFKKYEGLEAQVAKMSGMLETVATKYGLNPNDENFETILQQKIAEDNDYFETYAMEHDISVDEARKNIELERKVRRLEAEREAQERQRAQSEAIMLLRANAEKTKAMYPDFDLDVEMQNEKFRNLCAITNGDTTSAYIAIHHADIVANKVMTEANKAKVAISQSIASGQTRPLESGMSGQNATLITPPPAYKGMNAQQLREYAMNNLRR